MAYIIPDTALAETLEASTTYDRTFTDLETDDLVIVVVDQTVGATAFSVSSGWSTTGTNTQSNSQRSQLFYRKATSPGSLSITVTGGNETWSVNSCVVRHADTTTPFDVTPVRSSPAGAGTFTPSMPTTSTNNCLIIQSIHGRVASTIVPVDLNVAHQLSLNKDISMTAVLAYYNQHTAGTVAGTTWRAGYVSGFSAHAHMIAIRDATPSTPQMMPDQSDKYEVISYFSGLPSTATNQDAMSRHETLTWSSFENVSATTIDGIAKLTSVTVSNTIATSDASPWGTFLNINVGQSAIDSTGRWAGGLATLPSAINMQNKIFSVLTGYSVTPGSKGVIIVFEDGSGNWQAFRMLEKGFIVTGTYRFMCAPGYSTPIDSGGTINWTNITKIGFAAHRVGTSITTRSLKIKWGVMYSLPKIWGGNANREITPADFENFIDSWGNNIAVDGSNLVTVGVPIQIGDGTNATYYENRAKAWQTPFPPNGTLDRAYWQIPTNRVTNKIVASANDNIRMLKGLYIHNNEQMLDFTGSDPAATFDFQGQVYSGASVIGTDDIVFNGATFTSCYLVNIKGGGLSKATVSESLVAIAVQADDPGRIADTTFVSAGTGHAIEATATGVFDFVGNTFTGYASSDGTTGNEAFYNHSGGSIELVIPAGGQIPSVRNSAGSTTTITQPPVAVTATVLAGSKVYLYNATQATNIVKELVADTSFEYLISTEADDGDVLNIRVTKLGYEPFEGVGVYSDTAGLPFIVSQPANAIYNSYGVDGSTVTEYSWDGTGIEIDILDLDGVYSAKRLYAWHSYFLTTDDGIEEGFGLITANDPGNIELHNIYVDNLGSDSLIPEDNIRIFRTDGAYPQKPTTTGGGGIGFYSTGTIYTTIVNTEGSPVVTGDISDIPSELSAQFDAIPTATENASAVWSDTATYDSGTKADDVKQAKDNAELAAIK